MRRSRTTRSRRTSWLACRLPRRPGSAIQSRTCSAALEVRQCSGKGCRGRSSRSASQGWSLTAAACGDDDSSSDSARGSGSTASTQAPAQEDQGRPRHRHRRSQRPLVQRAGEQGPAATPSRELGVKGRVLTSESELRLRAEPLDARAAEVRPRHRRRLPHGRRGRTPCAKKFPDTKFAIIDVVAGGAEGQADERRGPPLQGAAGGLPRRLPRGLLRQGQQRQARSRRRRPEDPAGRPLHRRLPGGRQGGQPGRSRR